MMSVKAPTMPYVYDPELTPVLAQSVALDFADIAAARRLREGLMPEYVPSADVHLSEHRARGRQGAPDVPVFVLAPTTGIADKRPALLWIHGGGFVLGDAREPLPFLHRVVQDTGAVAVSVQYRLAPETPFPGPLDDAQAALDWLLDEAEALGVAPDRIAVCGQSAGGALAAGLALRLRDEGRPPLAFQLLDIPVLDDRALTQSARAYSDTLVWNRRNAELGWKAYLGENAGPVSIYAAPARAEDLHGLPPTFISVTQYDPLRDEGIEYARRLAHANIRTELHLYPGTFHGSSRAAPSATVSIQQDADLRQALVRAFALRGRK